METPWSRPPCLTAFFTMRPSSRSRRRAIDFASTPISCRKTSDRKASSNHRRSRRLSNVADGRQKAEASIKTTPDHPTRQTGEFYFAIIEVIPRAIDKSRDYPAGRAIGPAGQTHTGETRHPEATFYRWCDVYQSGGARREGGGIAIRNSASLAAQAWAKLEAAAQEAMSGAEVPALQLVADTSGITALIRDAHGTAVTIQHGRISVNVETVSEVE